MKKIVIAILTVMSMVSAANAFADLKIPADLKINDPAPCPFNNNNS